MKNIKYLSLFLGFLAFIGCNEPEDVLKDTNLEAPDALPELTAGSVDLSNYVAIGASFTAGYTDGGLFIASQQNSFPNMLSKEFAKIGGGIFTQPLMNDNSGGILVGGNVVRGHRLTFNSSTARPEALDTFLTGLGAPVPPITTEAGISIGSSFNNFGIPGAKSWHLLAPGYAAFNPYYARITSGPTASVLGDAMAQNPTFFTLSEVGGNDVLGYALTGGDGTDPITPSAGPPGVGFDESFGALIATLTSGGAKGVATNVPYVKDLPHFTTIVYNQLDPNDASIGPLLIPQIPTLNAQLYGPLDAIFTAYGEPDRMNILSATEANPLLIFDENAADRSAQIAGALTPVLGAATAGAFGFIFGKARQATSNDLILLPASSAIASIAAGVPSPVNVRGISYPMEDKWVLTPEEQLEIKNATDAYNVTIKNVTDANANVALVDLNSVLIELASTGTKFNGFTMNAKLVTGGAVSLDGFHLTARGYSYMAYKFLEAMDTSFGSNFLASENTPDPGQYPTNYSPLLP
ncbi:G-D-S-L family lipolytic protein [Algibacter sp.]|uniref:G-D-S-L family lipolytic protein n=1 Tax=Algibacter sp. TaxID=1872428 RepID=UPI003C757085